MNIQEYQDYLIPIVLVVFISWRLLKFKKIKLAMPELIKNGAVVVDVRSQTEFLQGSRPGSINIPLNDINARSNELDKQKTIVLCCASGARSGMTLGILKKNGFNNLINAGPWTNTLT